VKGEEGRGDQANGGDGVIPPQMRAEVKRGEYGEDREGDDFLDDLELDGRETRGTDAVGGHLQAVLKEGDAPADEDDLPQRVLAVFQVAIPGNGHEDVGEDEQNNGPHG